MKAALKPGTLCIIQGCKEKGLEQNNGRVVTAATHFFALGVSVWFVDVDVPLTYLSNQPMVPSFVPEKYLVPIADPNVDLSVPDAVPTEQVTS